MDELKVHLSRHSRVTLEGGPHSGASYLNSIFVVGPPGRGRQAAVRCGGASDCRGRYRVPGQCHQRDIREEAERHQAGAAVDQQYESCK